MAKKAKWMVYIIQAESGKLYTGITNDLKRRFQDHKSGRKAARFFRFSSPKRIVYEEKHPDRSKASKRECAIKKLTRKQKLELIHQDFPAAMDFWIMEVDGDCLIGDIGDGAERKLSHVERKFARICAEEENTIFRQQLQGF